MRFVFERLKIVVDENAAACVASLFTEHFMHICDSHDYRSDPVALTILDIMSKNYIFNKNPKAVQMK